MGAPLQSGWTRINTPAGRYEYQFQGKVPTVRNANYEEAVDYQFLVMDVDGWLYRIPVRVAAEAEAVLRESGKAELATEVMRLAEAQLRTGLREFTPRQNAPYDELDRFFAVDASRAREIMKGQPPQNPKP